MIHDSEFSPEWIAGFNAALDAASKIARLYEDELTRMASDTWMCDPTRLGDFSEGAQLKSQKLLEDGWRKGEAAETARRIAKAIEDGRS